MLIRYKEDRVKIIPIAIHPHAPKEHQEMKSAHQPHRDSIMLLPGINEVSEDEWEHMKLHIEREIATGDIMVMNFKTPAGKDKPPRLVQTIRDIDAKEAIAMIKESANPETLQRWNVEESRDEVRVVLKERMDELRVPKLDAKELEAKLNPGTTPVPTLLDPGASGVEPSAEDKAEMELDEAGQPRRGRPPKASPENP